MKAISLHMPWALWIAIKWKTIETRTHDRFKNLMGERIAIHASQSFDETAFFSEMFMQTLEADGGVTQVSNQMLMSNLWRGKILCTALVKEHRLAPNVAFAEHKEWNRKAMIEVGGKFCLFLEDIKPLKDPVTYSGQQGIFNVPDALIKEVSYEQR